MRDDKIVLVMGAPGHLRDGLKALLRSLPRVGDVRLTDSISSTRTAIGCNCPDLIVADTSTWNGKVQETIRRIKMDSPQSRVLALADSKARKQELLAAGADAALVIGTRAARLLETVQELLANPPHESGSVGSHAQEEPA